MTRATIFFVAMFGLLACKLRNDSRVLSGSSIQTHGWATITGHVYWRQPETKFSTQISPEYMPDPLTQTLTGGPMALGGRSGCDQFVKMNTDGTYTRIFESNIIFPNLFNSSGATSQNFAVGQAGINANNNSMTQSNGNSGQGIGNVFVYVNHRRFPPGVMRIRSPSQTPAEVHNDFVQFVQKFNADDIRSTDPSFNTQERQSQQANHPGMVEQQQQTAIAKTGAAGMGARPKPDAEAPPTPVTPSVSQAVLNRVYSPTELWLSNCAFRAATPSTALNPVSTGTALQTARLGTEVFVKNLQPLSYDMTFSEMPPSVFSVFPGNKDAQQNARITMPPASWFPLIFSRWSLYSYLTTDRGRSNQNFYDPYNNPQQVNYDVELPNPTIVQLKATEKSFFPMTHRGAILIADHPNTTVTTPDGGFTITDIPVFSGYGGQYLPIYLILQDGRFRDSVINIESNPITIIPDAKEAVDVTIVLTPTIVRDPKTNVANIKIDLVQTASSDPQFGKVGP